MKVYFHGIAERLPGFTTMGPFYRFALSQPITTIVIWCDNIFQLEENVYFATSFSPMTDKEIKELVDAIS